MKKLVNLFLGVLCLLFVIGQGVANAQTGLVAHWKLDETSGTTANDFSSYGNSGALVNGPTWVAGKIGGAVQLAGGSQYIVADNVPVNTTAGGCNTVTFWMKWGGTDNQMAFGWNTGYDLLFSGGSFGINTGQSDIFGIASSGLAGQWVHVALVFPNGAPSAANAKMYINGSLQNMTQRLGGSSGSRVATPRVVVSGWGNDGGYKFDGTMDDVRIYNRELSAAEVASVMAVNGLQLASNGSALLSITISPSASAGTKAVAAELKQYLDRISGASFSIQTNGSTGLVLGTLAEFPNPALTNALAINHGIDGKEAYVIRTEADRVLLLSATDKGVSHAAFRFLEELGCRWFFPSTNWEVVPVQANLQCNLNITDRPVFLERRIWYAWGFFYDSGHPGSTPEHPRDATTDYNDWSRHNRMSGSFVSDCGHAYERIASENAAAFAAHPEYWALVGGVRRGPQFELANPGLRQLVVNWAVNYFSNNPTADMVSVDPADGGGCSESPESQALGSASDNAFGLANEVARAVRTAFPGQNKMVGMYAYNWHSDPPSFPLESNVYIQLTMGFNGGQLTLDELFEQWPTKCTNLGFYDYYSTWRWDYDRWPGGRVASKYYPINNILRFQAANARSGAYATSISAESGDNWGLHGRSYYLANKLMWNPNLNADALLQDFYDQAFGPAAAAMKTYYGYQDNVPPICPGVYGAVFRAMQDASVAASSRPDVQHRLDDLKNYLNYEYLNQRLNSAPDQPTRDAITLQIWKNVYRMRYSYMDHWEAIRQDWIHEDTLPAGTPRPWRDDNTPISHAETEALFQEGLNYFPALVVPTEVTFSTNIVAVNFGGEGIPTSQYYQEGSVYEVISLRGEPLKIKFAAGSMYGYAQRYQITDLGGHVLQEGVPQPNQTYDLEVPVPAPGRYFFAYNDHGEYGEVFWKADQIVALPLAKDRYYRAMRPVSQMYFYVPKGTTNVNYYYKRAPWQYGDTHQVIDPAGAVVKEVRVDGDYVSFPVPAGKDGKVWSMGGPAFGLGLFYFFEVPNFFSPSPAKMLVPQDVALRDGLTILTGSDPILPGTPSGLTASAVSGINLGWTDNAAYETGFKIERKTGSGGTYAQIATVGTNVTSYQDANGIAGTVYYYRVRATNADGNSSYSSEVNATMPQGVIDGLPVTAGLVLRLDASQLTGMSDGQQVDTWSSAVRQGGSSAGYPQYKANQLNGKPVIRFNSANGNTGDYFSFSRITTIRTVFWVLKENAGASAGHFLLGDDTTYDFHRGTANGPIWQSTYTSPNIKNGTTKLMGTVVDGTTNSIPASQFHLISLVTAGNVQANQITQDRTYHGSWQGDIAEILIYDRALTSNEEQSVGVYLAAKYGLSTAYTQTLADSMNEFSSTQGQGNWHYGYYDKPSSANFVPDTWDNANSWWAGSETYCLLFANGGHPGSTDWSVRRWVAETSGTIHITGVLAKSDVTGGDGVAGHILVNGVEKWSQIINYNDAVGVNYSLDVAVVAGDNVDFAIDPISNYNNDSTKFTTVISATTPNPITKPAVPSGLMASAASSSQINLSWTDNANNEMGSIIERKTGSGGTYAQIALVASNGISYQNTGLAEGTLYYYRVCATNAGGNSAYSAEANATTAVALPAAPSGLSAVAVSNNQINLVWTDNAANETGFKIERSLTSGSGFSEIATAGANVTSYQNTGLSPATVYYYRVRANNAGGDSAYSAEASTTTGGLPSPWTTQDIGTVGKVGNASYSNGMFTIKGAGKDIASTADAFRFVHQVSSGDCELKIRVTSVSNTSAAAKAGVMIRESLNANAREAGVWVTPSSGIIFTWRTNSGGTTATSTSTGKTAPYWVRVLRTGNSFSAYYGTNGTSWTQLGTTRTISMSTNAYMGLGVCSKVTNTLNTATMGNVTASP